MLSESAFLELMAEIQSQGYDETAAARFASLIGDTPIQDQDGGIIVTDGGKEVARLRPLHFFGD